MLTTPRFGFDMKHLIFGVKVKGFGVSNARQANKPGMRAILACHRPLFCSRKQAAGNRLSADLDQMATHCDVSKRQLRFILTKEGTSYQEIVRQCKLDQAVELLQNLQVPISQVAYRVGFSDLTTFSRSFKRWTGKTPSETRHQLLTESSY